MFKEFYSGLSADEERAFQEAIGASAAVIQNKYLSPEPSHRQLPRKKRFEQILTFAEQVRPGELTREQLAAYFYAAPARTGTGQEAEAA